MVEYTNSQISALIDEYIHKERDRQILKDRLVDGLTYDELADKHFLSFQQIRTIVYKGQERLFKHL